MRVVLIRDVEGKGFLGDVVDVKDGYARNYLIPRGMALPATEGNIKHVQEILRQRRRKSEREKARAEETARSLEGMVLEILKPVGEGGKLFGSVTASDVVEKLKEKGIEIERKMVLFPHKIRELGVYPITIRLHREVKVEIKIDVRAEGKE